MTEVSSPSATYTYDRAHRLQTVTDSRGGKVLTYTYSAAGRVTSLRTSDGGTTSFGYHPVGRLTGLWAPNGDTVSFSTDPAGRLTEKAFPNGVTTRYTYDADNTLTQVLTQAGSSVLTQHDYTYDAVGNRLTHLETIGGTTTPYKYVYDALGRLLEVRNNTTNALIEGYTYDPLGNRLSKTDGVSTWTYLYDTAHQLTEARLNGIPQTTFTYDLTGNLSSRTTGGVTMGYAYDAANRLRWAGSGTGGALSFASDDQGRRIQQTSGATTTSFQYTGADIHAEYDPTWGNPLARYTHGPGVDDPLLRTTGSTTQYYHSDGLGSIVGLTDGTGALVATTRYDAWGYVLASSGTTPRYGYTGREPDDTGLVYYRARYYDPTLGRFTQRDPIGLAGGVNPYSYAHANPANFTDPSGLEARDPATTNTLTANTSYFQMGPLLAAAGPITATDASPGNTSGGQNLRFSQPMTAWNELVLSVQNLNDMLAITYAAMTGSSYIGTEFSRIVGGEQVPTTVTAEAQATEAMLIAGVILYRSQKPADYGKYEGHAPQDVSQIIYATYVDRSGQVRDQFEEVTSRRFNEIVSGSAISSPQDVAVARAAVEHAVQYGPVFAFDAFKGFQGAPPRRLGLGQENFGSLTDFGTVGTFRRPRY